MTYNYEISAPIAELLASQHEEIDKYKWFESQHLGQDIGWQRASDEWFAKYFGEWVQAQRRTIDEALSMADDSTTRNRPAGVRHVTQLQHAQP